MRLPLLLLTILSLALTTSLVSSNPVRRQAPNPTYQNDPFNQTASYNLTTFVFKVDKQSVYKMIGDHKLLTPKGLPDGWVGPDEHPVVLMTGLLYDIRQAILNIKQLLVSLPMLQLLLRALTDHVQYRCGRSQPSWSRL